MRWAYVGNFGPEHSTENEYRKALLANGHEVECFQESDPASFEILAHRLRDGGEFDAVLWTRTVWPRMDFAAMRRMLAAAARANVPTVGVHLDLWWGLPRSREVAEHPFFTVDLLCTADGGHDNDWASLGIDHEWLPPGVSAAECEPAAPDPRYAADVAFVGSWQGYHPEHRHRAELVRWLLRRGCRLWPERGQPAVRGGDLRRLYATTTVNVGDSCFAGTGLQKYWSDRVPETLGRGGFLLHPHVPGIEDHYTDGEHLRLWPAGDWVELGRLVDHYLNHDDERRRIAEAGRRHVLATATYDVRVREIVALMAQRGMVPVAA